MADLKIDKKCDILVRVEQDGDVAYYRAKGGSIRKDWEYDPRPDYTYGVRKEDITFTFEDMKEVKGIHVTPTANLVEALLRKDDRIEELERKLRSAEFNHREALRENDRIIEKLRGLADELAGDAE